MTRLLLIALTTTTVVTYTACDPYEDDRGGRGRRTEGNRFGYRGDSDTRTVVQETTSTRETIDAAPQTPPPPPPPPAREERTPPPTVAPPQKKDYPYATPVPGKPGFVTSPHAPYSGYVDVRGFPPGTEVKDPYTNRIFLVP